MIDDFVWRDWCLFPHLQGPAHTEPLRMQSSQPADGGEAEGGEGQDKDDRRQVPPLRQSLHVPAAVAQAREEGPGDSGAEDHLFPEQGILVHRSSVPQQGLPHAKHVGVLPAYFSSCIQSLGF